jgi:uncharacterized repeat protein (TIGR02543 family)
MKKILSMLFVLCIAFALARTEAFAADTISGDGYSYNTVTKVLTVTSNVGATYTASWRSVEDDSIQNNVISIIVENGVTEIDYSAFSNCPNLTSVRIGDGTTKVKSGSIVDCPKLESVHFGNKVNSIDYLDLYNNPKLTAITVGDDNTSYKSIGDVLFTADGKTLVRYPEGKKGETYEVPSSVEIIANRAFYRNAFITTVILTDSVTKIGHSAFHKCTNLQTISLGTKLETIGEFAFNECSKLSSIDIPSTVTSIGEYAFAGCSVLTTVTIPEGVSVLGDYVFYACGALATVTIPSGVSTIGNGTFYACHSLTTVTIPSGVSTLGNNAFWGCSKLRNVIMEGATAPTLGTDVFNDDSITTGTPPTFYTPIGATGYDDAKWPSDRVVEGRAGLSNLYGDAGFLGFFILEPSFTTKVTSYTVSVENDVTSVTIHPTIGAGDRIKINGKVVASDSNSDAINLEEGVNNITIVVENDLQPAETKTYTILVTRKSLPPESMPSASFTATGPNTGNLTNISTTMRYSVDKGTTWNPITGSMMIITGVTAENGIQIKRIGNGSTSSDSAVQTITVTKADTPSVISSTNETSALNDGTITGVSDLMEYKKSDDTDYDPISGSKVTGLAPGEYLVRIAAKDTVLASESVTLTITAFTKITPTAGDLIFDLSPVEYNGTAKPVSVSAGSGKNLGVITVKYNGSTTEPINAGTYVVTADISGSVEANAVTGLFLGSYTISKAAYPGTTTVSTSVLVNGQAGATVMLPALPIGASYATTVSGGAITVTGGAIRMSDISVADTTLTYTAPAGAAGETGTITIPVTGAINYNDYDIIVTITYTAKTPQAISFADTSIVKTYGDAAFINPLNQTIVKGTITYISDDTSVAAVNPSTGEVTIVAVGDKSATITGTVSETDTHAQAVASYTVTVARKALTLKAEDKSMKKGEELPAFTYSVTGLVNGDAVTTAPTMSTTTSGDTAGSFDITITGGAVDNAVSYDITYAKGILIVAEQLYAATVTDGTGSGSYAEGTIVTITASSRSGYTFTGWSGADVTFADATASATTFTMPAKAVTIIANYRQNSSDGDSGGSGNDGNSGGSSSNDNTSPVIVTPPAPDKPNSPTQGEIKVPGKADKKGNIIVDITEKTVIGAFDQALEEAKKNGNEQNGIIVVLHVENGSKTGSNVTVNLPKSVQDTIIEKKIVSIIVVVDNPDIQIGMDLTTVQEINKQAKSDVSITATRTDNSRLTGDAREAIDNRPVFDLKVSYGSGKQVESFGSGSVSVNIPYTLSENEKAGNIQAVYIDAKGKAHWLVNSVYDNAKKVLRFSTDHFSTYGIGYKQVDTTYKDVVNHHAKEKIEFVVSRGLMSGISTTVFRPNSAITRGIFVTALGRLANADVSGFQKSSFIDVKNDDYYMGYIEWANINNILTGTGNGTFSPNQSITREHMAVIMLNYAKAIGFTLPKVYMEHTFDDSAKISAYAKDAVKQMYMAGVISGKSGNLFDPQGTATRAEVSAVLFRFVKLTISSDTMQGWAQNDTGEWLYYKNGKSLTDKQTIDEIQYLFNSSGILQTGWVEIGTNKRYFSDNRMLTGWQDMGSGSKKKTYYFSNKGNLIFGKWLKISGKWYYFYKDGSLAKSTKVDGYEVGPDGVRKTK